MMKKIFNSISLLLLIACSKTSIAQTTPFKELFNSNYTTNQSGYATLFNNYTKALAAGDINEDGFKDVVSVGYYSFNTNNYISIQYGNCKATFYDSLATLFVPGIIYPTAIELVDLNHDSHLDIIAEGQGFLLYYQGDGHGLFATPIISTVPIQFITPYISNFAVADFNQDGNLDLYTNVADNLGSTASIQFFMMYGDGSGHFTDAGLNFNTIYPAYGSCIAIDVNNDSIPDLAQMNGSVLINNGGLIDTIPQAGITFNGINPEFRNMKTLQSDADTNMEFYAITDSSLYAGDINIVSPSIAQKISFTDEIISFAVGDFDYDGYVDDVVVELKSGAPKFFKGNANLLTAVTPSYVGTLSGYLVSADINGDGKWDIISGGNKKVNINLGNFRFTDVNAIPLNGTIRGTCSADFDRDGFEDVAACLNSTGNNLSIVFGNGCGIREVKEFPGTLQSNEIKAGYFNNDSLIDLVVTNQLYNNIYVYLNLGNGNFSAPTTYNVNHHFIQPVVYDFNRDGYDDIFMLSTSPVVYNMIFADPSGNGTFGTPTATQSAATISVYGADPEMADFNHDGNMDISISHDNALGQRMTILYGDGTGNFPSNQITSYSYGSSVLYCAPMQLNNDGYVDMIATSGLGNYSTSFYCRDSTSGVWGSCNAVNLPYGMLTLTVCDLNNDSINDFVGNASSFASGISLPCLLKPDFSLTSYQQQINAGYSKSVAVDFNADGFKDLCFFSANSLIPFQNTMPGNPGLFQSMDTLYVVPQRSTITPTSYEWFLNNVKITGANLPRLTLVSTGTYHVGLAYPDGSYVTSKFVVTAVGTGLQVNQKLALEIFPNPTNNFLTIKCNNENHLPQKIEVLNLLGEHLSISSKTNGNALILDVTSLNAGVYMLLITQNEQLITRKFVKE